MPGGKPYIAADRFTAADISVSYIVTGAKFAGIEGDIPAGVTPTSKISGSALRSSAPRR